jgi:hypothetical protein
MCGDCSHEARECKAAWHGDRGTRPRQGTVRERKNVGVILEDAAWRLLRCDDCGTTWVPAMPPCVHRPGARFCGGIRVVSAWLPSPSSVMVARDGLLGETCTEPITLGRRSDKARARTVVWLARCAVCNGCAPRWTRGASYTSYSSASTSRASSSWSSWSSSSSSSSC